jgi:hypothetical protein
VPGEKPSGCKVYPLSPSEQKELDAFLKENLETGRIRPSKSPIVTGSGNPWVNLFVPVPIPVKTRTRTAGYGFFMGTGHGSSHIFITSNLLLLLYK